MIAREIADDPRFFVDECSNLVGMRWVCDDHHSNSHVQRAVELVGVERTELLHKLKERGHGPRAKRNVCANTRGQDTGHVVGQPATSDVNKRLDAFAIKCLAKNREVIAMRFK